MTEQFILELIGKFDGSTAVSMNLTIGDAYLELKKSEAYKQKVVQSAAVMQTASVQSAPPASIAADGKISSDLSSPAVKPDEIFDFITSPIVGTFYRSPSPDAPSYAEEGKKIQKGQPVCILEAMKMMNNLEAEYDCIIDKILACNGDMIEFGQKLFQVRRV